MACRVPLEAIFNYQADHVVKVVANRDTGGSDSPLEGADWVNVQVNVANGRGKEHLTLDQAGFELLQSPKKEHINYYNEAAVIEAYYPDCEALCKAKTGAAHAFAFDHNVRCQSARENGSVFNGVPTISRASIGEKTPGSVDSCRHLA